MWSFVPLVTLFYIHAFWLMPSYLFRKRMILYVVLLIVFYVGAVVLSGTALRMGVGVYLDFRLLRRVAPGFFFVIASASVGAFREVARRESQNKEKETTHLRAELSFLRGQVNPHFMLNVLNSMVLLARRKSDTLEHGLMELAKLMGYMLYESGQQKVSLEDEITYLRAYIDLQMLRFGDDLTVRLTTPESCLECEIEPMLLIPLVENAFKHGMGFIQDAVIKIDITASRESGLTFCVENLFNASIQSASDRLPGIGLANLRKRLELIYPGRHAFIIAQLHVVNGQPDDCRFIATLNIPLQ